MHLQTEMDSSHQDYVSPIPEFKPPVEPQLFRLDETPYMSIVDDILNRHNLDRPSSRLTKYQHLFFVQILTQFLGPLFLTVTFICNIARYTNGHSDMTWNELIILTPIIVTLPMVSLSFPIYWLFANYVALGMFCTLNGLERCYLITYFQLYYSKSYERLLILSSCPCHRRSFWWPNF